MHVADRTLLVNFGSGVSPNLDYQLRAYQTADACRWASIIQELAADSRVSRDDLVARWAQRYPRHVQLTGRYNIRSRIKKMMPLLKVAGIVATEVTGVVGVDAADTIVLNPAYLAIAASNLAIVEDSDGANVVPGSWPSCPNVPEYLRATQAKRVQKLAANGS